VGGNFLLASRPKPRRLPNVLGRDPQKNALILLEEKIGIWIKCGDGGMMLEFFLQTRLDKLISKVYT